MQTNDIINLLYEFNTRSDVTVESLAEMISDIAVPVVRCKDCAYWCICHHGDNWFCADGTPINTASDYYDDKGHLLRNPPTCKSIYGERKEE